MEKREATNSTEALRKNGAASPTSQKDDEDKPKISPGKAYFKIWTYASPLDILARAVGTCAILAAGTALPLMTIIFGRFVNVFNGWGTGTTTPAEFRKAVNENALYLVYIFIGRFTMSYLGVMLYNTTASRITRKIRLDYVRTVINQPISYFDRHSAGSISTNLTADVNQIEIGLGEKISLVFLGISMIITSFTIALTKNWKLALVCLTIIPWTVTITGSLAGIDTKIEASIKAIYSEASTIVEEALSSIGNITALGASEKIVGRFQEYVNRSMQHVAIRGSLWATIYGNMFFSTHAIYALCLFYGVKLVHNGEIRDGGTVMTVMFCCILGSSSLGLIAPGIPDFIKAGVAAQRVLTLLEPKPLNGRNGSSEKPSTPPKELEPRSVAGNLQLRGVSFAYPSRASIPVLSDVNMDFPAGQVTAIVGTSGSGKSTIIALLERWYTLQTGAVLLDGEDMEHYSISSWRNIVGLVQQESMLFDDSIFQNILNGYHGADCTGMSSKEKEHIVVEAAKKANAHEFIQKLPDGYNTKVGERAARLSGGQKQRIAIARAIVSDPKILLLDEATSALDSESEKIVQKAIDQAAKGRTTVEISHNLSTVRGASKIIVMDEGKVMEEGTHQRLLDLDGLYSRLVSAQTSLVGGDEEGEESQIGEAPTHVSSLQRQDTSPEGQLQPSIVSEAVSRKHGVFWGLKKLITAYPRMAFPMFLGLAISLGIAATFPLTAFLFSKLITVFQLQGQPNFTERGNFWALMFFVMACCEIFIYFGTFYLLGVAGVIAGRQYRPQFLKAMLGQDSEFFSVDGHSSGALLTLLFSDAENLEVLVASNIPIFGYNAVSVVTCGILAIAIYWKLGLVCSLGCLPLIVTTSLVRMRMDMRAHDRCEAFFIESARFVGEAIGSVRTVASLRLEDEVVRRYNGKLDAAVSRSTKGALLYFIVYAVSDSVDLLVMSLLFWYGGRLISFYELSIEQFFIIYTATLFGGQAAGFAFGYSANFAKGKAALNRIFYLLDSKPSINTTKGQDPAAVPELDTIVEFRDVYFHYPTRRNTPILRGFSLKVRKGENVCLVGRSGCGKSTILSLLERFYDVTSGEILINGQPLASLDVKKYREALALVGQETTLYQGTVRDNLLLGVHDSESITEEDIIEACKQASIHDFIVSLPDGYSTDCGPRGTALSGGQRQRIAIARALLRKPDVLLLDEATSALDAENEGLVRSALERARKGRTTVAAAHQIDAMKGADRVVVVERGKVAEEGTYDELMAKRGALWKLNRDVLQG